MANGDAKLNNMLNQSSVQGTSVAAAKSGEIILPADGRDTAGRSSNNTVVENGNSNSVNKGGGITVEKRYSKRTIKPTHRVLESLKSKQENKDNILKEKNRTKRKYKKRSQTETRYDSTSVESSLDDDHEQSEESEDDTDFTCCLCISDLDYTEIKPCGFEEEKKECDDTEGKPQIVTSCKPKYNPHNALLICDNPNCNRVYHQLCHFIPVLTVPRASWYCLICKYEYLYNLQEHDKSQMLIYGGTKKSQIARRRSLDKKSNKKSNDDIASIALQNIVQNMELPYIPFSQIFPLPQKNCNQNNNGNNGSSAIKYLAGPSNGDQKQETLSVEMKNQYQSFFEEASRPIKMYELQNQFKTLQRVISQCVVKIRSSGDAIRFYTENPRLRKSVLQCTLSDPPKRLPAELVLSKQSLLMSQYKIRTLLESLEFYIQEGGGLASADELYDETKSRRLKDENANKYLCKRREPREFAEESDSDSDDGENACEKKSDEAPDTNNNETGDHTTICTVCFSPTATRMNDIILCDGKSCYRAFHMKCVEPNITRQMIDDDTDGAWYCPYCLGLGKLINYVQNELYGDDYLERQENENKNRRKDSITEEIESYHWESVDEVFTNVKKEMVTWGLGDGTNVGESTKRAKKGLVVEKAAVYELLDLPLDDSGGNIHLEEDDEDDEEDYDPDEIENSASPGDGKKLMNSKKEDDGSSVSSKSLSLSDISRAEIDALSTGSFDTEEEENSDEDDEDEEDSVENSDGQSDSQRNLKTRKRKLKTQTKNVKKLRGRTITFDNNCDEMLSKNDKGVIDSRNIVRGKRRRTKVDYRK